MNRRNFLNYLCCIPFAGFLIGSNKPDTFSIKLADKIRGLGHNVVIYDEYSLLSKDTIKELQLYSTDTIDEQTKQEILSNGIERI